MKKLLSFVLAAITLLSVAVCPVFADDAHIGYVINCDEYNIEITGENECSIIEYKGSDGKVKIPETIEGYTVTSIGENAFAFNRHLMSVEIPQTVKTIGEGAFFYCYNLGGVTIPKQVLSIGEKAFGFNRRTFDTETCTYTYRADFAFTIYATPGTAGAKYATANGCELNEDEHYNDFCTSVTLKIPYQWTDFNTIYCHMWDMATGEIFTPWQSNDSKCDIYTDIATYSPDHFTTLNSDTVYGVIFSTDTGEQTFPAIYIERPCSTATLCTDKTYVRTPNDQSIRLKTKWWGASEYLDLSAYENAFGIYNGATFSSEDEATPDVAVPEALPWGDANCDNAVNIKDATAIQKHLADLTKLSDTGLLLCDFITKDSPLTIRNATEIQKFCADMRTYELIGNPAVTRLAVQRPDEWYRKDMQALSWTDPDKVQTLEDANENTTNEQHAVFYVPIYNQNFALTCNGYTTETWIIDFYAADIDGECDYVCEYFDTVDGKLHFIWTIM